MHCHKIIARHGSLILLICLVVLYSLSTANDWSVAEIQKEVVVSKKPSVPLSYYVYYEWEPTELISQNSFNGVKARAFGKWHDNSKNNNSNSIIPCYPPSPLPDKTDKALVGRKRGLFYLKLVKTGGSTCNGINARIARNVAIRTNAEFDRCESNFGHSMADELVPNRNRKMSFLWSTLRDPTSRAVSRFFFFTVSRGKFEPSDAEFRSHNSQNCGHYMRRLPTSRIIKNKSPVDYANEIMQEYDFLGIMERMDESTVALSMLLGVPLADVLYVDAKRNGGYDEGTQNGGICTYIVPTFVSNGLKEYFKTREFQDCVRWDNVLYQVANRSLDLTIEKLGRAEFEIQLDKFRAARTMIQTKCQDVVFPCSSGGVKMNTTDCLWQDSGCGFHCLDQVATELNLW